MTEETTLEPIEKDRNTIIGENVRYYRTARRLSLQELANGLPRKLTAQQIANYETGKSRWPADLLAEVSLFLRADIRRLVGTEFSIRPRKESEEWKAESYKNILLSMKGKTRLLVYRIIDAIEDIGFNFQPQPQGEHHDEPRPEER